MTRHAALGERIHSLSMRHCGIVYLFFISIQYLKNGYLLQPNFDIAISTLARDPFQTFESLPSGARYVTTSWLMPFLLNSARITSESMMVAAHWLAALLYLTVCYLIIRRISDLSVRLSAVVLLGVSPIIPASFNWLGYDTVTLLLLSLTVYFATHPPAVLAIATLLGMQHFEIGLTAALAWLLASRTLPESHTLRRSFYHLSMIIGLIAGRLLLIVVFAANGASMEGSRIEIARDLYRRAAAAFLSAPFSLLWSIFGVGWFAIIFGVSKGALRIRWYIPALSLLFLVSGLTLDASRVAIVSSSLVVLGGVVLNEDLLAKIDRRFLYWSTITFLLVPRVWIWEGNFTGSCTPENVGKIFSSLFNHFGFVAQDCRVYWVSR